MEIEIYPINEMEKWLENEGCFIFAEENWDSEVLEVAFLHVGYNLYCISITHPLNKLKKKKPKKEGNCGSASCEAAID